MNTTSSSPPWNTTTRSSGLLFWLRPVATTRTCASGSNDYCGCARAPAVRPRCWSPIRQGQWPALPAEILRLQEARYQQKQTEVKAFRDQSEAEQHAKGGNRPSPEGQWDLTAAALGKTIE